MIDLQAARRQAEVALHSAQAAYEQGVVLPHLVLALIDQLEKRDAVHMGFVTFEGKKWSYTKEGLEHMAAHVPESEVVRLVEKMGYRVKKRPTYDPPTPAPQPHPDDDPKPKPDYPEPPPHG